MKLSNQLLRQFMLCVILAATLAFGSHVLIQSITKPLLYAMSPHMQPSSGNYPLYIVAAAYLTALITISVQVMVYYYAGHLLKISNKIIKSLVLAIIILESKGELIRYTFVGYLDLARLGAHHPLLYILINQLDQWIPNLILAFCLVYCCPQNSGQQMVQLVNQNNFIADPS